MREIVTLVCLLVLALGVGGFSAPAQAEETGTHVHKMPPAPESWGEAFKDIWTATKLTGDWHSRSARPRPRRRPQAVAVLSKCVQRGSQRERRVRRDDGLPGHG